MFVKTKENVVAEVVKRSRQSYIARPFVSKNGIFKLSDDQVTIQSRHVVATYDTDDIESTGLFEKGSHGGYVFVDDEDYVCSESDYGSESDVSLVDEEED